MKVSFFEMGQRLTQLVAGAMDVGLYRAERQVQDFGDFLVGPPLDMAEKNAGAVLGPQGAYRRFNRPAQLLCLDSIERGLLPGADLESGGLHGLRRFSMRRAVERQSVQLPPTEVINGCVVPDLEYPGREFEFRAIGVDRIEGFDERLLGRIVVQLVVRQIIEEIDRLIAVQESARNGIPFVQGR